MFVQFEKVWQALVACMLLTLAVWPWHNFYNSGDISSWLATAQRSTQCFRPMVELHIAVGKKNSSLLTEQQVDYDRVRCSAKTKQEPSSTKTGMSDEVLSRLSSSCV